MAFRIREANLIESIGGLCKFAPQDYVDLFYNHQVIGRIHRRAIGQICEIFPEISYDHSGAHLPHYWPEQELTQWFAAHHAALEKAGLAQAARGEDFAVYVRWGDKPCFFVDRALLESFGLRGFGVHVNGLRQIDGDWRMILGKRAAHVLVDPGRYDNLIGGGISGRDDCYATLLKEGQEEAGFDKNLLEKASPVGVVTYNRPVKHGLRRDTLFLYDLVVPEGVDPHPQDEEMSGFSTHSLGEVFALLKTPEKFKFNIPVVLAEFMIRRGYFLPDDPDYEALITLLHQPL